MTTANPTTPARRSIRRVLMANMWRSLAGMLGVMQALVESHRQGQIVEARQQHRRPQLLGRLPRGRQAILLPGPQLVIDERSQGLGVVGPGEFRGDQLAGHPGESEVGDDCTAAPGYHHFLVGIPRQIEGRRPQGLVTNHRAAARA